MKALAKWILRSRVVLSIYEIVVDAWQESKYDEYREQYSLSPAFSFNGEGILLYGNGDIVAKADSYVGRLSRIFTDEGAKVEIGKNCAISHHVMMYTSNRVADQDLSQGKEKRIGNIVIGDHCWIGANVFITEGAEIGENSVVGANSVVTDNIPPHSIATGTPARVVRFKSYLDETARAKFQREYAEILD